MNHAATATIINAVKGGRNTNASAPYAQYHRTVVSVAMRILDLFCCEGGAAMGYHQAGFEVVGVDIEPRPNYPFEFIQADAMTFPLDGFDAIHASPPCQFASMSTIGLRNAGKVYPDLLAPTRERLLAQSTPWVIENVPGAPMRADYLLCGSQFGLMLVRHRLFEVSWGPLVTLELQQPCTHDSRALSVTGHGTPTWVREKRAKRGLKDPSVNEWRESMGMPWASRKGLSQAIPPAYTEYIGKQLLAAIVVAA